MLQNASIILLLTTGGRCYLCDKMGTHNCKIYYRDVTLSTQHEPKQMPVTLSFTNKLTYFPLDFYF
jgi:hypothetical protein